MLQYNLSLNSGCAVYSIDRFTIDFVLPTFDFKDHKTLELVNNTCALLKCKYFSLGCQDFVTKRFGFEKHIYQIGGLHMEVSEKTKPREFARYVEESEEYKRVWVQDTPVITWRLDFNPNKCKNNLALFDIFGFFAKTSLPYRYSISRVDYALDVPGEIDDYYVLSRKATAYFGSTRYYGKRGTTGYLRVYDKRREVFDTDNLDIGYALTRFEWEQRNNSDFNFSFDKICAFSADDNNLRSVKLLKYVPPEMINLALSDLDPRTRQKAKDAFKPIGIAPVNFELLLEAYFVHYGLNKEKRHYYDEKYKISVEG